MQIPQSVKIGKRKWRVSRVNMRNARGKCIPNMAWIEMGNEDPYVFWHEITHAILHDMGHPLWADEKFVSAFSKRLNQAIQTARF
jgi:hypothetical protein